MGSVHQLDDIVLEFVLSAPSGFTQALDPKSVLGWLDLNNGFALMWWVYLIPAPSGLAQSFGKVLDLPFVLGLMDLYSIHTNLVNKLLPFEVFK